MREQQSQNASTVEVNDIIEVLWQHNFPNRKQIEVLKVINYFSAVRQATA